MDMNSSTELLSRPYYSNCFLKTLAVLEIMDFLGFLFVIIPADGSSALPTFSV